MAGQVAFGTCLLFLSPGLPFHVTHGFEPMRRKAKINIKGGCLWITGAAHHTFVSINFYRSKLITAYSGKLPSSAAATAARKSSGPLFRTLPTLELASNISISSESSGRNRSTGSCSVNSLSNHRS